MNSVAPAIEFQVVKKGSCLYSINERVGLHVQETHFPKTKVLYFPFLIIEPSFPTSNEDWRTVLCGQKSFKNLCEVFKEIK